MKTLITFAFLVLSTAICANEFQDSFAAFADNIATTSGQINEELALVNQTHSHGKFYCNEIVIKPQPELGVTVAGLAGLKFAFSAEFTVTRAVPKNLEINKP